MAMHNSNIKKHTKGKKNMDNVVDQKKNKQDAREFINNFLNCWERADKENKDIILLETIYLLLEKGEKREKIVEFMKQFDKMVESIEFFANYSLQ